jgi:hypothetical protein
MDKGNYGPLIGGSYRNWKRKNGHPL